MNGQAADSTAERSGARFGARTALGILAGWLAAAGAFTAFGGLRALPPPFPQALLAALVALLIACHVFVPSFRRWVDELPPAWTLGLHVSRFVGIWFLVLHARGELPYAFAVPGGWGDIAVATLALALLAFHRGSPPVRSLGFQVWNVLGLVDILLVVATAARILMSDPAAMAPLTALPLGLLPTFLVPLIIFTHAVALRRGLRPDDAPA
jgi:hypothetical protein